MEDMGRVIVRLLSNAEVIAERNYQTIEWKGLENTARYMVGIMLDDMPAHDRFPVYTVEVIFTLTGDISRGELHVDWSRHIWEHKVTERDVICRTIGESNPM